MEIEIYTFIEVENEPHIWAVLLEECKESMSPVKPSFIGVANQIGNDFQVIENTLSDSKPIKIIDGVNGGISDDYIQVGFWRIKT